MILISSGGYIYTQDMDASSSAVHGPFYVTNTIDIVHPDISVSIHIIILFSSCLLILSVIYKHIYLFIIFFFFDLF